LPGVGLDIDTPEDLHELARAAGDKPSQMLARRLGFGEMRKLTGNSTEQNTLAAKS
jgi:2-phospho-L-lactate guanylyltransferase (CobY/MobA/RfbA family)